MRVSSLTGLRGVAAVAVMLYHIPLKPVFEPYGVALFSRSYLCVDLFFVLSGFVISIGYYDRVVAHMSSANYRDFLINRMARVYPLHLIVALVFTARFLINLSGEAHPEFNAINVLANVLMIQSWGLGTEALAGNSWSVSTELMAYLLFPAIGLMAFSRLFWLQLIGALVLLVVVATSGLGAEGPMDVVDGDSVLPLARCLAGFALGVLAYRAALQPWCRRLLGHDAAFVAVCAAIAGAFLIPRGDLLVVMLCPLLVVAAFYNGPLVRAVLSNRPAYHLGLISYSIYLWHPLFIDVTARVAAMLNARGITGYEPLLIAGLILATWLGCWISYQLIEVRGHLFVKGLEARFRHPARSVQPQ